MKTTRSKSTKLKCGCDSKDVNEFCELCCPEEFECLKWPHIQEHIKRKLEGAKPTKYQIGDKVWVLGNRIMEEKTVCGVCLEKDYKDGENVIVTRYELDVRNRHETLHFFYTDDLMFTTQEALIDSLRPRK